MTALKFTCHCGAVELQVQLSNAIKSARRCDCSICAGSGPQLRDGVENVKGNEKRRAVQMVTNTAKHYFSRTCGIYTQTSADQTRTNLA